MARVQFKTGNEQYGNLANLRKAKGTGKQVGETLAQPTGQTAHVEGSSTVPVGQSQPAHVQQPVVTDNTIAQLNAQQETEQLQKQLKQATIEHEKLEKRMNETQADIAKKERELAGLDKEKHPHRAKKLEKQIAEKNKVLWELGGKDTGATQKIVDLRNKLNIPIKPQAAQIATPVETAAPKATTSTVKAGEHAAESSASQGVTRAIQSEEAAAAKGSKGFFSKVAKFFKGKKGIAAGIGAAVAIGAAVVATKSCNSGDTTTPTQPEGTKPVATPVDTTKTDSAKAQPAPQTEEADKPQAAAQPKAQTTVIPPVQAEETEKTEESNATKDAQEEQELQEADEADKAQQAEKEHEAQKGDTYWGYARFELIAEHQGDPNYKPTNAEITERMHEIMKRNGAKMDKDGIHPLPMLNAGDKVKVKAA